MTWPLVISVISCYMMMSCSYHLCTCVEIKKRNDILLVVILFNDVNNGEEMSTFAYEFELACGQAFVFSKEIDFQTIHLLQHLDARKMGGVFLYTYKRIIFFKEVGASPCNGKINVCYLKFFFLYAPTSHRISHSRTHAHTHTHRHIYIYGNMITKFISCS